MAGKDNISDLGKSTRFSRTNQPKRNGRKPSTYALIKKLFGTDAEAELSKEDYYKLIAYLLERPIEPKDLSRDSCRGSRRPVRRSTGASGTIFAHGRGI